MHHVKSKSPLAISHLATVLDSEGWTALWYTTPTGAQLVTDAPIEVVHASLDTVSTAMGLPRTARAPRTTGMYA